MDFLASLFNSKQRAVVLQLLFGPNRRCMYLNEMVQVTGVASRSIEVELRHLTGMQLVISRRDRSRVYYSANPEHPLVPALRQIVQISATPPAKLQEALASPEVEFAFIAAGETTSQADDALRLTLVVRQDVQDIPGLVRRATECSGTKFNVTTLTIDEIRQRLEADDHEIANIVGGAKQFIIGREDRFTLRVAPVDQKTETN